MQSSWALARRVLPSVLVILGSVYSTGLCMLTVSMAQEARPPTAEQAQLDALAQQVAALSEKVAAHGRLQIGAAALGAVLCHCLLRNLAARFVEVCALQETEWVCVGVGGGIGNHLPLLAPYLPKYFAGVPLLHLFPMMTKVQHSQDKASCVYRGFTMGGEDVSLVLDECRLRMAPPPPTPSPASPPTAAGGVQSATPVGQQSASHTSRALGRQPSPTPQRASRDGQPCSHGSRPRERSPQHGACLEDAAAAQRRLPWKLSMVSCVGLWVVKLGPLVCHARIL